MPTQNIYDLIAGFAIVLPAFLVSLSFHEFFHAMAATLLGDNTPRNEGRLTLNPLAHVDPLGLLFLLLFRIGWAKPVVFNHRHFAWPKLYSIITALAGPFANFILALVMLYDVKYFPMLGLAAPVNLTFLQIFQTTAAINIMLGVFNLLPIPPLDGSHLIMVFLLEKWPQAALWIYRYSFFMLVILLLLPQSRMILVQGIAFAEHVLKVLVI